MSSPTSSTTSTSTSTSPSSSTSGTPSWQTKPVSSMTPEERLLSLQSWAETKKFVIPGESGTLPLGRINALALGGGGIGSRGSSSGAMEKKGNQGGGDRYTGQYEGVVGPPSYQAAMAEGEGQGRERRKSAVGRWLERRKEKRGEERVPAYVP